MIGYIYLISSSLTSRIYVGKTITTISNRWSQHKNAYSHRHGEHPALHAAFDKYGIETFSIKEIDKVEANTKEELNNILNNKERYWISFYDSFNNGYNCTLGGDGGTTCLLPSNARRVAKIDIQTKQILAIYDSLSAAAFDTTGIKSTSMNISAVCRGKQKTAYGYRWSYVDDNNKLLSEISESLNDKNKKVYQISLENFNIINIFSSVAEAAESLNEPREGNASTQIAACCRELLYSARGYQWRYEKDKDKILKSPKTKKRLYQIDPETNQILKIFNSIIDAEEEMSGIRERNKIANALARAKKKNNTQAMAYNFLWIKEEDYERKESDE